VFLATSTDKLSVAPHRDSTAGIRAGFYVPHLLFGQKPEIWTRTEWVQTTHATRLQQSLTVGIQFIINLSFPSWQPSMDLSVWIWNYTILY